MAHTNDIITPPIEIADVKAVLTNESSNDLGTLCERSFNQYALYRPYKSNAMGRYYEKGSSLIDYSYFKNGQIDMLSRYYYISGDIMKDENYGWEIRGTTLQSVIDDLKKSFPKSWKIQGSDALSAFTYPALNGGSAPSATETSIGLNNFWKRHTNSSSCYRLTDFASGKNATGEAKKGYDKNAKIALRGYDLQTSPSDVYLEMNNMFPEYQITQILDSDNMAYSYQYLRCIPNAKMYYSIGDETEIYPQKWFYNDYLTFVALGYVENSIVTMYSTSQQLSGNSSDNNTDKFEDLLLTILLDSRMNFGTAIASKPYVRMFGFLSEENLSAKSSESAKLATIGTPLYGCLFHLSFTTFTSIYTNNLDSQDRKAFSVWLKETKTSATSTYSIKITNSTYLGDGSSADFAKHKYFILRKYCCFLIFRKESEDKFIDSSFNGTLFYYCPVAVYSSSIQGNQSREFNVIRHSNTIMGANKTVSSGGDIFYYPSNEDWDNPYVSQTIHMQPTLFFVYFYDDNYRDYYIKTQTYRAGSMPTDYSEGTDYGTNQPYFNVLVSVGAFTPPV